MMRVLQQLYPPHMKIELGRERAGALEERRGFLYLVRENERDYYRVVCADASPIGLGRLRRSSGRDVWGGGTSRTPALVHGRFSTRCAARAGANMAEKKKPAPLDKRAPAPAAAHRPPSLLAGHQLV
jgi:hypothetical protein